MDVLHQGWTHYRASFGGAVSEYTRGTKYHDYMDEMLAFIDCATARGWGLQGSHAGPRIDGRSSADAMRRLLDEADALRDLLSTCCAPQGRCAQR